MSGEYPQPFSALLSCVYLDEELPPLPGSPIVVAGSRAVVAMGPREVAVRAPDYQPPDNPGWWADEPDLSDDDEPVVVDTEVAGCVTTYKASVRGKVRYSTEDGVTRRHNIPDDFKQAMLHEECDLIWQTCLREFNAQEDCRTWEQRPAQECYDAGMRPIDCRWVFDVKVDQTSLAMLLWKARIVARGDQMVHLRDFFETYAGVVRHSSFRIFLALCAIWGLVLTGADVSTAYLHAPLRGCTVWMRPPPGFEHLGYMPDGSPALLLLRMALYGLRQSAREWAITMREWLMEWVSAQYDGAFRRLDTDSYIFLWRSSAGILILLLWVDDIFMGHSCDAMRAAFMADFAERFRVKDLGLLRQGLGADIQQDLDAGTVAFGLERYLGDVARRFDLHVDNSWADIPVPVALAKECKAERPTEQDMADHDAPCRIMTGVVVHVATFARPDVQYAAQLLSSLPSSAPKQRLCRRVLGYLARTKHLRVTYRRDADGGVRMLEDADHGDARSITGWLIILAGGAISWGSRGQPLPSLSSTEAELYGLSTAVCELLVVLNLLEELGYVIAGAVPVFCDSRGARLIVADCAAPARTRHIHRRWFFVRYYTDSQKLVIKEIKGSLNHANFMTKAVGGSDFARDRAYALGMR